MHGFTYGAILAAVVAGVAAQDCDQDVLGNYYCEKVEKVVYTNVKANSPGSYNRVTDMSDAGSCSSEPKSFSGPMKPLDEEVSSLIHSFWMALGYQLTGNIAVLPLPWPG
jgi:hypothetical protein